MGTSFEVLHNLLKNIGEDSTIAQESQLPSFDTLQGRVWSTPLVFLYRGDTWPALIYPWRLWEASCTCFSVERGDMHSVLWRCLETFVDEEQRSSSVLDQIHVVRASRFELVGTAFSIERYQVFSQGNVQLKNQSLNSECTQPVGSSIIRVITNESGELLDERMAAHCLAQLDEKRIRHVFFLTSTPLLGVTTGQAERKWPGALTTGVSHSDSESGGVSSIGHSSHSMNEEVSSISPDAHLKLPHPSTSSNQAISISEGGSCNKNPVDMSSVSHMPVVGSRLEHNDLSLRWDALRLIFDQEEKYHVDVVGAWSRWTDGWDEVSRFAVVNSIDDIITSLDGSREAAHVAVAYLDMFLYVSPKVVLDPTYFSGILLACAMLSCKQVDRFFPPVKSFLRCVPSESQITEEEFLRYEMHVLRTLEFRLQYVTSLEVVETLLHLCISNPIKQKMAIQHRQRELKRWGNDDRSSQMVGVAASIMHTDSLRWDDMCKLTRFFNDIVARNTAAQGFRPTVLGFAIFAVAAEKASWLLPAPMLDLLPESFRTSSNAASQMELVDDSYELLQRYMAMMRFRDELERGTASVSPLFNAICVVRECCKECMLHPIDGVLRRRYNIGHPMRF